MSNRDAFFSADELAAAEHANHDDVVAVSQPDLPVTPPLNDRGGEQTNNMWHDLGAYLFSFFDPGAVPEATPSTTTVATSGELLLPTSAFTCGTGTWHCETNNKFLMRMCSRLIGARISGSNNIQRNWRWGVLFGLAELWLFESLTSQFKLPLHILNTTERHEHVIVHMPDHGVSCFHAYYPAQYTDTTPVMLIFPSLTANQNFYSLTIQYVLQRYNWIVVVMNRRGLCQPLRTPVFHIMGDDDDVSEMMQRLEMNPRLRGRTMVGVGFSMGGNVLTRYIGRFSQEACEAACNTRPHHRPHRICAGATVCSPLNLSDVQVQTPLIEDTLVGNLKRLYLDPYASLFLGYSRYTARVYQQLRQCRSLVELAFLHMKLFCPQCVAGNGCGKHISEKKTGTSSHTAQHMFAQLLRGKVQASDVLPHLEEYRSRAMWEDYAEYDAAIHARSIQVPFLAITAADDPIVRHSPSSQQQLLRGRHTIRVHSIAGSHCLFRDDVLQTNACLNWAEQLVLSFLQENLVLYASSTSTAIGS